MNPAAEIGSARPRSGANCAGGGSRRVLHRDLDDGGGGFQAVLLEILFLVDLLEPFQGVHFGKPQGEAINQASVRKLQAAWFERILDVPDEA